jgi:hypothetical protein
MKIPSQRIQSWKIDLGRNWREETSPRRHENNESSLANREDRIVDIGDISAMIPRMAAGSSSRFDILWCHSNRR